MDTLSLREKMASEITLSKKPGSTIRKWREIFNVSQRVLASHMHISPSMISDYEGGRRRSPGISTIRRIVDSLLEIDMARGGEVIKRYTPSVENRAIISIGEFMSTTSQEHFVHLIEGRNISNVPLDRSLYGYTVIDSVRAITSLNSRDYPQVFGWTNERALIFTGVKFGRSPMVAVRTHPLKPALVVYHQPEKVDPLAPKLAELEWIPLIVTEMDMDEMLSRLSAETLRPEHERRR